MSKIFIVTKGEYSDYGIEAVFSTRELAEEFRQLYAQPSSTSIEEYDLDSPGFPSGKKLYCVLIRKDGFVEEVEHRDPLILGKYNETMVPYGGSSAAGCTYCWASDEQHAVKIANERRVKAIAEDKWYDSWNEWKKAVCP